MKNFFKNTLGFLALLIAISTAQVANASHPEISGADFIRGMVQSPQYAGFREMLFQKLDSLSDGSEVANTIISRLKTEFDAAVASADYEKLNHWPVLHINEIAVLQRLAFALSGQLKPVPAPINPAFNATLESLLADCTTDYALPPRLERFPNLRNGHFPDQSISPCEYSGSEKMAAIFTALALNGVPGNSIQSQIQYNGKTFSTATELASELLVTGHRIQLKNERVFANFLSFIINDQANLRMPLWLNTGLTLNPGNNLLAEPLVVPMGHSQYIWVISGPVVNARLSFYLGTSGVSFNARNDERPTWTGSRIDHSYYAYDAESDDATPVLQSLHIAETYLRRIKLEHLSMAENLRADGYGLFGVCNDSSAVLEYGIRGTISGYPLVRPSFIDRGSPVHDDIESFIRALPRDPEVRATQLLDPDFRNQLGLRVLTMIPHYLNSPAWWDLELKDRYIQLMDQLGETPASLETPQ